MLLVHDIHPALYWLPLLKCIMIQALCCDTMLLAHMQDLIRNSLPSCQVLLEHSCQLYLGCTCKAKKEMMLANKRSNITAEYHSARRAWYQTLSTKSLSRKSNTEYELTGLLEPRWKVHFWLCIQRLSPHLWPPWHWCQSGECCPCWCTIALPSSPEPAAY